MVYLTKGGSWIGFSQIVATATGFLLTIAFANLLTQNEFGIYKYIVSTANVIAALSLTGLGTAVAQATARGYEGMIRTGIKKYLKWSFGIPLIALGIAAYYFFNDNTSLALGFAAVGIFMPFIKGLAIYNGYLKGKQNFRAKALYSIPRSTFPILVLIPTLFITNNPGVIALIFFAAQALVVVGLYLFTLLYYRPNTEHDPRSHSFGKHVSFMNLFSDLTSNLDQLLLFHLLGPAPVAIFTFAKSPIREISKPKQILHQLAFPKFSKRSITELKSSLPRRMALLYIIIVPLILGYIAVAPFVFEILFPQYTESVIYTQVLSVVLLFIPLTLANQVLAAHMQIKNMYIVRVVTPLTRIMTLAIGIPLFGIWGAVAAMVISRAVNAFMSLILFLRASS
jgi:O-antigen/teichoic acid export membrane protein